MKRATGACGGVTVLLCCIGATGVMSSCADGASHSVGAPQKMENRLAIASAITSPTGSEAAVDAGDSVADIQSWIDTNYYADADIQHTFHTIFGEQIDCIDFYAQYSVKTLVATGIAVPLPGTPPPPPPGARVIPPGPEAFFGALDDNGQARECVGTTVPTMRPTVADVQNRGGIAAYAARGKRSAPRDANENTSQPDCYEIPNSTVLSGVLSTSNNYDHVAAYQDVSNTGIYDVTTLAVPILWDVYDHTNSQVWIQTGDCEWWVDTYSCAAAGDTGAGNNEAVQSLEVGWQAGEDVFSDVYPHLFFFTTKDGYHETNYYNNESGSPWVAYPGAPYTIGQIMTESQTSPLTEMTIQVNSWGGSGGYWWVFINQHTVGYVLTSWYASGSLMASGEAKRLQVGGEVHSNDPDVNYTYTAMGSGIYPDSSNESTSAYVSEVSYINGDNQTWYNASMSYVTGLPSYEGDLSQPGVCGYASGWFYNKCDGSDGCSAPNDSSAYGWWFYFGGTPFSL
jgi:hypothetical protein